jgi:hypothetical protein
VQQSQIGSHVEEQFTPIFYPTNIQFTWHDHFSLVLKKKMCSDICLCDMVICNYILNYKVETCEHLNFFTIEMLTCGKLQVEQMAPCGLHRLTI